MSERRLVTFRSQAFISIACTTLFFALFCYVSLSREIRATDVIQKNSLSGLVHLQNYYDDDGVLMGHAQDQSLLAEEEDSQIEEDLLENENVEIDMNNDGTEEGEHDDNDAEEEDSQIEEDFLENENVEIDMNNDGTEEGENDDNDGTESEIEDNGGTEEGEIEEILCPTYKEGSALSPHSNLPQNLTLGSFTSDSSSPYLGKDIWAELVDNKRTFFLRQYEPGFPNMTVLREWVSSQPHPITLLMNNHRDFQFPCVREQENLEDRKLLELLLNETNLHAFYIENLEYYPKTPKYAELPVHPKMKPLPRGLRWQWKTTKLFGESKAQQKSLYSSISSSAEETEKLFRLNRSDTVWVKPNYETNDESVIRYFKDQSTALRRPTHSGHICEYLKNALETKKCSCGFPMNQTSSFPELLKHRFVVSPSGISLDSYFTWDALLSGCIPIVPHSPFFDSMWEDLPVWVVDSWDEVTDEAVKEKAIEMSTKDYNFEKLFSTWWEKEIQRGLCKDDNNNGVTLLAELSSNDEDPKVAKATNQNQTARKIIKKGGHEYIAPAIGPDNSTNYVHNPFFMVQNPKEFTVNQSKPFACSRPGEGNEKIKGLYYLEKIRQHLTTMKTHGYNDRYNESKIFCSVYSYGGGVKNTDAIWETWGKRCDGFFIASSESNLTTGHTYIPTMLEQDRAHTYGAMWQKVRNMMAYIYDNFLDSFDYFHFSGDDTFLIVENLREFLSSHEVQNYENIPGNLFYAGFPIWYGGLPEKERYNGGGSGYTLSKRALKAFVEGPLQVGFTDLITADEDRRVGMLFRDYLNVSASDVDTRDDIGAHRYHQFGVDRYAIDLGKQKGFYKHFTKKSLWGLEEFEMRSLVFNEDYVSTSSIAFHKMSVDEMKRYEMILYKTGIEKCGENMTHYFDNVEGQVSKPNFGMEDELVC